MKTGVRWVWTCHRAQTSGCEEERSAEERLGCISGFWAPHTEEEILQEHPRTEFNQLCPSLCDPMEPARLLCPWDSPGKNTRVSYHALLQGIFLTQGSKLNLPHLLRLFATESPGKPITNINIGSFYLWDRICVNHFS